MKRWWQVVALALILAVGVWVIVGRQGRRNGDSPVGGPRIVSLAPSVTELIFALGLGDNLVGRTDRCDWPAQARRVEPVGGFGTPNMERLLALRPDLIVAAGIERKEALDALRPSGIGVLDVRIRNFDELFAAIADIGRETARPAQAATLIASMRAELDQAARRYATVPPDRRPRVFAEIWNDPLTTAGAASFLNDLIVRAGGVNVAGELDQPHPRLNPEKVIAWDPDVIVTAYMGRPGQQADQVAGRIGWARIKAVRNRRIIDDIPADILLRPGPRLVEGVKALAERLYPAQATSTSEADTPGGPRP